MEDNKIIEHQHTLTHHCDNANGVIGDDNEQASTVTTVEVSHGHENGNEPHHHIEPVTALVDKPGS